MSKKARLPPTRGITPVRNVRIDDALWQRTVRVADRLNMTASEFVRRAVEAEVRHYEPLLDARRPGGFSDIPSSLHEAGQ